MKKYIFYFVAILIVGLTTGKETKAQNYKLRQVNNMMGMKSESTIYVKGMRKRTESGGMMGMPAPPITIEQCDLQRTIKINDKKKLYYIEPFSKEAIEMMNENEKPVPVSKVKNVPPVNKLPKGKVATKKGGIIYMYYSITDTGERKKMNGFTARHVWTVQKMKPSADACMMKDSMIIKTDGWYIDLPQFNCPVNIRPDKSMMRRPAEKNVMDEKQNSGPQCVDSFVNKRSGKGKLGFPLSETRIMIFGGGAAQQSEMETSLETLEFSSAKLDSMLFEIPLGYTETMNEEDLQEKMDMKEMMKEAMNNAKNNAGNKTIINEQKQSGKIRIGVYEPKGDGQLQASDLQNHLVGSLTTGNIEAIAISTEEDAKKFNCDYLLNAEFTKIKQAGKVGSILKAIKNTDPNAITSFNIEASLVLTKATDGSVKTQQKVEGKYDGKINDAATKALDDGSGKVLNALQ